MTDLKLAWDDSVHCDWNYENKETDTEISFIEKDKKLFISFQGSGSFLDWLQNFMFSKIPYKEMKETFFIHRGFIKKYKSVRTDVLARVEEATLKGMTIEIRGFSQGAALATVAHEDIGFHFSEPNTIVFGCPRVFGCWNRKFLETKFKKLISVSNSRDAVTGVPFVILGFKHYGSKIKKKAKYFFLSFKKNHLSYGELV